MTPTFFDLHTGKTAKSQFGNSAFWWTEGDGACDCNRAEAFGNEVVEELDSEQHRLIPDLRDHQSVCFGCKRFIAIDVEGDFEGLNPIPMTKEEILVAMNSEYAKRLRRHT